MNPAGVTPYFTKEEVFALYLQDGEHIVILVEGAVNGRHLLKRIDLAASLHVEAHCVFNIKLALKARALFENVEVWAISAPPHRPSGSPAFFLSLTPNYDKEFVSHRQPCREAAQCVIYDKTDGPLRAVFHPASDIALQVTQHCIRWHLFA